MGGPQCPGMMSGMDAHRAFHLYACEGRRRPISATRARVSASNTGNVSSRCGPGSVSSVTMKLFPQLARPNDDLRCRAIRCALRERDERVRDAFGRQAGRADLAGDGDGADADAKGCEFIC